MGVLFFDHDEEMTAKAQRRWVNAYRGLITTLLGVISYFLVQTHLDVKDYFKSQRNLEQRVSSFEGEIKGIGRQLDRIEGRVYNIYYKQQFLKQQDE